MLKALYLQLRLAKCALHLRSVCVAWIAFRGLRCHPLTCISLKLRLSVDSSPTVLPKKPFFSSLLLFKIRSPSSGFRCGCDTQSRSPDRRPHSLLHHTDFSVSPRTSSVRSSSRSNSVRNPSPHSMCHARTYKY